MLLYHRIDRIGDKPGYMTLDGTLRLQGCMFKSERPALNLRKTANFFLFRIQFVPPHTSFGPVAPAAGANRGALSNRSPSPTRANAECKYSAIDVAHLSSRWRSSAATMTRRVINIPACAGPDLLHEAFAGPVTPGLTPLTVAGARLGLVVCITCSAPRRFAELLFGPDPSLSDSRPDIHRFSSLSMWIHLLMFL